MEDYLWARRELLKVAQKHNIALDASEVTELIEMLLELTRRERVIEKDILELIQEFVRTRRKILVPAAAAGLFLYQKNRALTRFS